MAKTAKKKTKFPVDREKVSETFLNGNVVSHKYTSNPALSILVHHDVSDDVKSDILNAIDDVLKFHSI